MGDITNRWIEFRQHVETTYSPAHDFGDVIVADPLGQLGPRQVLMKSERLGTTEQRIHRFARLKWRPAGTPEIDAENLYVESPVGGVMPADKEVLSIEGDGRLEARIFRKQGAGRHTGSARANAFATICASGELQTDSVKNIRFPLPPNIKLPNLAPLILRSRRRSAFAWGPAMTTVADLCDFLETFAPAALAAEWDNVGLLVGDRVQPVERVMTCLTITPAVAAEAIRERADLIVTHHPLPFKPLKRLTAEQPAGQDFARSDPAGVAVHSPHTAFDSAASGINQQLAEGLGLTEVQPLEPVASLPGSLGSGRWGSLTKKQTLGQLAAQLKQFLKIGGLHVVGHLQTPISRVAIACARGRILSAAIEHGCQVLVTGETRLHTCYDAEAAARASS